MAFHETLHRQLEAHGLVPVQNQKDWYWRAESPMLYLVCLEDAEQPQQERWMQFIQFGRSMQGQMERLACTKLVALTILMQQTEQEMPVDIAEGYSESCRMTGIYPVFWCFCIKSGRIIAPQGHPDRLLGIERLLRAAAKGEEPQASSLREEGERAYPWATFAILLICLAALLWTQYGGQRSEIIRRFCMSRDRIAAGEYYRFLSCMFLHADWMHLISNGIYLYYFGTRAESLLGTGRFLLLYLGGGICGSLCSLLLGGGNPSIGASGAIFGLIAAMLLLAKQRGLRYTGIGYTTILLLVASAICIGFFEPWVDNWAHIGGLLGGIVIFQLLMRQRAA